VHRRILATLAVASFLVGALGACAGVSRLFVEDREDGLAQVDVLLDHVERVHVESVLARERAREALVSLRSIVAPDFGGDPLAAYARFVDSVDRSEAQAAELRSRAEPMRLAAEDVFDGWADDLGAYRSEMLREQSRERLTETRERYDAIVSLLGPAQTAYDELNDRLRDLALFFERDFNASAVSQVKRQVEDLGARAVALDQQLSSCQQAAQQYVRSAALRGEVVLTRTPAATDGTDSGKRPKGKGRGKQDQDPSGG